MSKILKELSIETGLREYSVYKIMTSAPRRYKTYFITKKDGGLRKISQPAREVKVLQRALVNVLLSKLPVHDCATAYRVGYSILDNVAPHIGSGPILKMDFSEFFSSIKKRDWQRYCRETGCIDDPEDIELTSLLIFQKTLGEMQLAIGAPSSPMVSNILMYEFDSRIANTIASDEINYTRYADDLGSGPIKVLAQMWIG